MANLEYKEKILGVIQTGNDRNIAVSHITIRQSIFFLVLRIIVVEAIATIAVVLVHTIVLAPAFEERFSNLVFFNIPIFIFLVILKLGFLIFVISQWLNEYYEITTREVIYRRGIIMRREDRHKLDHIGSVELDQSFLGRIFNYGTLKLFVWTTEKEALMYLIHNPRKYQHILEDLLPEAEKSKKVFREHIIEPDDDSV